MMNEVNYMTGDVLPTTNRPQTPASPLEEVNDKSLTGLAVPVIKCPRGAGINAIKTLISIEKATHSKSSDASSRSFSISDILNNSISYKSTTSTIDSEDQSDLYEKTLDNVVNNTPLKTESNRAKLAQMKYKGANRMLSALMQNHLRGYYNTGCTQVKTSLKEHFKGKKVHGKREKTEWIKVDAGISNTKVVKIGGVSKNIVKKVSLPEEVLNSKKVKEEIAGIVVKGLNDYGHMERELDAFITTKITHYFSKQIAPYYTGANREKLAELIGKELGVYVPAVEILKTKGDKVYSSHKYETHTSTLQNLHLPQEALPIQSIQDVFILDAILKNQDRHTGNLLFTKDGKAIPIDHALSLQGSRDELTSTFFTTQMNPSLKSLPDHANRPLTQKSIEKIKKFNVDRLLGRAIITEKLKVEIDVKNSLRERSRRAKLAILIPGITAHQFMQAVCSEKCLKALQINKSLTPAKLMGVFMMDQTKFRAFLQKEKAAIKIQNMVRGASNYRLSKKTIRKATALI